MSETKEYIHVFVPSTDSITVRIDAALRAYRGSMGEPDRIELGDAERLALEDWATDAGLAEPGRPLSFARIPIRCVESPRYLAVVGDRLTVKVYSTFETSVDLGAIYRRVQ